MTVPMRQLSMLSQDIVAKTYMLVNGDRDLLAYCGMIQDLLRYLSATG